MKELGPPKSGALPLSRQIAMLLQGLKGVNASREDPRYRMVVGWVKDFPASERPGDVFELVAKAFNTTTDVVRKDVEPKHVSTSFDGLVPTKGWLADYVAWTRNTEPPTVFHFFTGCVVLGSALRRNIHFDKGYGGLFPNFCVILVAPSGKCRKTTCCEIGVKLFRDVGGVVLPDQLTPEALVDTFADRTEATGLIFAGELKQFLGEQKYMASMVPLLTRLLDCPDTWVVKTMARGEVPLNQVGLSFLGATTMDWLRKLPGDAFGGGFMSRFILICQEDTPRSFPRPPEMDREKRGRLLRRLMDLSHIRAKVHLTPGAERWYDEWYVENKKTTSGDKMFSGYYERKSDHVLRMAMTLSISHDDSFVVEVHHLKHAVRIFEWVEQYLPNAFDQLTTNAVGEDHRRMLNQLKANNGTLDHSTWLRRNSSRMDAKQFKSIVATMREAKLIDVSGTSYYLTSEGWKK